MHADSWESISSYLRCQLKTSEKSQFYLSIPPFLGYCTETMRRQRWNVRTYNGRYGFIRLVDYGSGSWGYIAFDDLRGNIRCESKFSLFYSFVSERYKDWLTIWACAVSVKSLAQEGTRWIRCMTPFITKWRHRSPLRQKYKRRDMETVDQLFLRMLCLLLQCELSTSASLCLQHQPYAAIFISVTRGRRWRQRHRKTRFSFGSTSSYTIYW